jgi:hypothetical protein
LEDFRLAHGVALWIVEAQLAVEALARLAARHVLEIALASTEELERRGEVERAARLVLVDIPAMRREFVVEIVLL